LPGKTTLALLDPRDPHTLHAVTSPDYLQEFKASQFAAADDAARQAAEDISVEFEKKFGRSYPLVESFQCKDAETVILTTGTAAGTARYVVRHYREAGRRIGLLRMRMFRPYPFELVRETLRKARRVAVLERAVSPGSEGVMCQEVKAALYGLENAPAVYDFVSGLGGRDILPEYIEQMVELVENGAGKLERLNWLGTRE
ncbi:MAG TPA: pyruvate ferredoxin oxidoreductase, partial [Candidatus Glassbacteria bacterium]|nr:pyruvate ferredoxin oxidoreductase [Candidatus Glassbacteria bacterium]